MNLYAYGDLLNTPARLQYTYCRHQFSAKEQRHASLRSKLIVTVFLLIVMNALAPGLRSRK